MSHIVEIFRGVVSKVEANILAELQAKAPEIVTIHYEHGHYSEIDSTLIDYEKAPSFYNKKYPLVALFEDVAERDLGMGYREATFTIVICYSSDAQKKSADRYESVINPILEPIYKELLRQIKLSGMFMSYNIEHEKIVRPYWGVEGKFGNRANIMSDILDAIELRNIRLKVYPIDEC